MCIVVFVRRPFHHICDRTVTQSGDGKSTASLDGSRHSNSQTAANTDGTDTSNYKLSNGPLPKKTSSCVINILDISTKPKPFCSSFSLASHESNFMSLA